MARSSKLRVQHFDIITIGELPQYLVRLAEAFGLNHIIASRHG